MLKYIPLFLILVTGCQIHDRDVWTPQILKEFIQNPTESILPDFSYAGYAYGETEVAPSPNAKVYSILDYGAIPNDSIEDTRAIQNAVDQIGKAGGGILEFPSGKFLINMDSTIAGNIKINYSNIVLRGSGADSTGTIIYSGNSMHHHQPKSSWLTQFAFHTGLNLHGTDSFYTVDVEPVYAFLKKDVLKGEQIIHLEKTVGLKSGMFITLAMRNTTPEADLIQELMKPVEFEPFQTSYLNAGLNKEPSFQWTCEVDSILDEGAIRIKQPAKRDILTKYQAFVAVVPMLENIGIENFRFECAYKGGFQHHFNAEHDYGWGAVCLHRVAHGWMRNLTIDDYTQTTHLVNSRNVTITDITITGVEGHYGPKLYNSSDNLIQNITVLAPRNHGPGIEGASFGNVFYNIELSTPQPLDLHGMADAHFCPPMYNLFENISNVKLIAGGGAPANTPHAGEYNTFWNIDMSGFMDSTYHEVFSSWIWRDPVRFNNEMHIDCHKQYLRSIVVGVYHTNPDENLSIEYKSNDREDEWIYVEGLNRHSNLVGLYATQLKNRLENENL